MNSLLSRIDIACSLDDLLTRVINDYRLGSFQSYTILPKGYQELNILLITSHSRFVVKIFSKEKTLQRIQDNVWGYRTFREEGVPLPTLRKTANREYIFPTEGRQRTTYLVVMEYFNGSYLYPKNATEDDTRLLAFSMATIHSHTERIHRYNDTMGIVNLVSQYKKFKSYLPPDLLALVEPVVKEFSSLRLNEFRHSIIHGTFEPENILKNTKGDLCLLDLGCMDYHASVVDIATFLANYTIDLSKNKKRKLADIFLHSYQDTHPLSKQERTSLPVLVRSQYATYVIRTNYYRVKLKDTTEQTFYLFETSKLGLQQGINLDSLS